MGISVMARGLKWAPEAKIKFVAAELNLLQLKSYSSSEADIWCAVVSQ